MPHYRTMLTSENLCAADLWDEPRQQYREVVVQIELVKKGEVVGEKGRKKGMPFAHFVGKQKPLGLNATNCKTLAHLARSPNTDQWKGLWITLFVTKTDVGRETVDAIRIRPELAQPPPASARKSEPPPAQAGSAPAAQELSEADKRAIELAEAEEAKRGR